MKKIIENKWFWATGFVLALSVLSFSFQSYHKKTELKLLELKTKIEIVEKEKISLKTDLESKISENKILFSQISKLKKSQTIEAKKYYPDGTLKSEFIKKNKQSNENSTIAQKEEKEENKKESLELEKDKNVRSTQETDLKQVEKKEEVKKSNLTGAIIIGLGIVALLLGFPAIF